MRASLLQYAEFLGLRSWARWLGEAVDDTRDVFFMGYQDNPFRFIGRAALYACTSSWEGFPNSVAEAMACGTPVLASDCSTGPRELLSPGSGGPSTRIKDVEIASCGYLMPLLDGPSKAGAVDAWVAGIEALLCGSAERTRVVNNASLRVRELSREHVLKAWEQVLVGAGDDRSAGIGCFEVKNAC